METNIQVTDSKEIEVELSSRDFKITPAIQEKIDNTLTSLQKYSKHIKSVKISLSNEKGTFKAKILLNYKGKDLKASDTNRDLYKAINGTVDKLKKQMKKYPTFIKGNEKTYKTGKKIKPIKKKAKPKLGYSKMRFLQDESLKPMFKEEAKMQMKLAGLRSFHYIDAETFAPAIVYNNKKRA